MQKLAENPLPHRTNHRALSSGHYRWYCEGLWILFLSAPMMLLSACGGGSSSVPQQRGTLSGNWQFSLATPMDGSFTGGLQGGFLLQTNGSVTGQAVYAVSAANIQPPLVNPCNSGTATITGTITGQTVTLTAVAGTQTFTLTGTLSSDGSSIDNGKYTSTAGTASDGVTPCGAAETGVSWSANSVPPLTGSITGTFHSISSSASFNGTTLNNQDFPVTGLLTQGENIGASNATVTGTLSFIDPTTLLSNYPCIPSGSVSVNGQISGNTVILQLIGTDGSNAGQIGVPSSEVNLGGNGKYPVTFDSTTKGSVLHSIGTGYVVNTKPCFDLNQDIGYLCLALNSASACQQPITLSPAVLIFPSQQLGSTPTAQPITLTNISGHELDGLTLNPQPGNPTDFNSELNFTFTDNCGPNGAPAGTNSFNLGGPNAPTSCVVTVSFVPQESCTWVADAKQGGTPPAQCALPLGASLTVTSPVTVDNDPSFTVPISGTGSSFIQPSIPELDFGAQSIGEVSLPQLLSFTNHSASPVKIVGPRTTPCQFSNGQTPLLRPVQDNGAVAGLQVATGGMNMADANGYPTIYYNCDADQQTELPNFQISSDTCTNTDLVPQATCSLQIVFAPQPATYLNSALDYFLELNTVQCESSAFPTGATSDCEIDSGRFPVELKANAPSPLRMSPAAGLDFGNQTVGSTSIQQTITLFNDPADPKSATVNFYTKVSVKGNYSETDDCPFSLAPGATCTLTVTFKPKTVGFNQGSLNILYTLGAAGTPGNPQSVYLRGMGQ
jgi:hypothetical protein